MKTRAELLAEVDRLTEKAALLQVAKDLACKERDRAVVIANEAWSAVEQSQGELTNVVNQLLSYVGTEEQLSDLHPVETKSYAW